MTSHVEAAVRARIAAVKRQREARRLQRAEFDERRQYGLDARQLAKMTRWAEEDDA